MYLQHCSPMTATPNISHLIVLKFWMISFHEVKLLGQKKCQRTYSIVPLSYRNNQPSLPIPNSSPIFSDFLSKFVNLQPFCRSAKLGKARNFSGNLKNLIKCDQTLDWAENFLSMHLFYFSTIATHPTIIPKH